MERNEDKIGEQPALENLFLEEKTTKDAKMGSPLGKFKNVESLLDAYNSLQSEFTKKCQKIGEIQKRLDEMNDNVSQNLPTENSTNSLEQADENSISNQKFEAENETPQYLKEGWQDKINEFVTTHKYAISIMTDLADELTKNSHLACKEDCLELAYNKILAQKFKQEDELLESEDFIQKHILNNEKIKMRIISNYLSQLDREKTPPVISQKRGGYTSLNSNKKISSLGEAKKIAELLFDF